MPSVESNYKKALDYLLPRLKKVIATHSEHPQATSADKLVELANKFGCSSQEVSPVDCALAKALDLAGQECAVVIAGSLFVAAAREAWPRLSRVQPYERVSL